LWSGRCGALQDVLDGGSGRSFGEHGASQDVLPPEGNEEVGIGHIDRVSAEADRVSFGGAGDRICNGRAVGWEGRELEGASVSHFGDAPGACAVGAKPEDKSDARPKVINQCAAELGRKVEGTFGVSPAVFELKEHGIASHKVERSRERTLGGLGGASGGGQGEAAPNRVEVRAVVQGQGELVAEWSSRSVV
jgi:hypothetical protein